MRKQLLLALTLVTAASSYGQNKQYIPHSRVSVPRANNANLKAIPLEKPKGDAFEIPFNNNSSLNFVHSNKVQSPMETTIGNTQYDTQTNGSISNRLVMNADNTISAVWTTLCIGCSSVPDRGTGYNYFDGTSWGPIPATKIEPTQRAGFTNIAVTASGAECVIAHSSTVPGVLLTRRATKGTGAWIEYPSALGMVSTDTWCKAVAGGANGESIHTIVNANTAANSQNFSIYYSRSLDAGLTWPVLRTVIPNMDASHYYGWNADEYAIDARGDVIAIVAGSATSDQILVKSMDNGNTWTTTTIEAFPISFYNASMNQFPDLNSDGTPDTLETPSGDANVVIDNNGMCHVWFTRIRVIDPDTAATISYFPNANDGLFYWNESFGANPPVDIAGAVDYNGNGVLDIPSSGANGGNGLGVYGGGLTQTPSGGVDASNNLYVCYSTFTEWTDTLNYPGVAHKHVYVIKSVDNGINWSIPYDVTVSSADDSIQEGVFACMARRVDNNVHLTYQRDYGPGTSLSTNATEAGWNADPSDIIYVSVPVTDLVLGVNDNVKPNNFSVGQNNPNPAKGITNISYSLSTIDKVTFTVTDVVGKVIYTQDSGTQSPGSYNINLNTAQMNSGLYFYTVKVGANKVTRKMVIE